MSNWEKSGRAGWKRSHLTGLCRSERLGAFGKKEGISWSRSSLCYGAQLGQESDQARISFCLRRMNHLEATVTRCLLDTAEVA